MSTHLCPHVHCLPVGCVHATLTSMHVIKCAKLVRYGLQLSVTILVHAMLCSC